LPRVFQNEGIENKPFEQSTVEFDFLFENLLTGAVEN
jgi:hypothetical protein